MRAPVGNNGNLKSNWRRSISIDFSNPRKPIWNTGVSNGTSLNNVKGGKDESKVPRYERFYRFVVKQAKATYANKALQANNTEKELWKLEDRRDRTAILLALAEGTEEEPEIRQQFETEEGIIAQVKARFDNLTQEAAELWNDFADKRSKVHDMIKAKHARMIIG